MLQRFIGYQIERERDEVKSVGDRTVMHLVQIDAWIVSVVATIDTEVRRGVERETFLSARRDK